jgi:hypothetical protein
MLSLAFSCFFFENPSSLFRFRAVQCSFLQKAALSLPDCVGSHATMIQGVICHFAEPRIGLIPTWLLLPTSNLKPQCAITAEI